MGCGCSRQAEGSVVDPKGSAPTESALASLRNLEDDALGGDDGVDQRTQHLAAAREKKKKEREEHARAVREENERAARIEAGISGHGGQEEGGSEEDSEDEDGEQTMVAPKFDKGNHVTLRKAMTGRRRVGAKPDLNSGYAMAQVRKHVVVDASWSEPEPSEASLRDIVALPEGVPPPIPKWRNLWVYLVSCAQGADTNVEVEVLHSVVIPLLRSKYTDRMVHLFLCDPRERDEPRDGSAADAREALAAMQRCAKESGGAVVFVAFRGDRYGWVPSGNDVPSDLSSEWPQGCSVQHAELQAALALGAGESRGLVMYRQRGIPGDAEQVDQSSPSKDVEGWRKRLDAEQRDMRREEGIRVMTYLANREDTDQGLSALTIDDVGDFETLVRGELDKVIGEWCDAQGMPASLSQIARAEAKEDAKDPAPVVNISKKSGRAGNAKSRVTVPTFRQTVAWRCHNAAGEFASRQYIDRKESLEAVFHSIRSGRQTSVLLGEEGSGKTSILGRVSRRFRDMGSSGWLVLNHFAGAGRDWVSVRAMVRRFCAELSEALHLDMPVPHGFKEASSQFIELLVRATKTYGIDVLCIVDGYDQMEGTEFLATHNWIPMIEIPAVHIVCSCAPRTPCHVRIMQRDKNAHEVHMVSLTLEETAAIFDHSLRSVTRGHLEGVPIDGLLDAATVYEVGPLWTQTAAQVVSSIAHEAVESSAPPQSLKGILVGEVVDQSREEDRIPDEALSSIRTLVTEWTNNVPDIQGLLTPLFDILEISHGADFVADLIALVTCTDTGLPEPVLVSMLMADMVEEDPQQGTFKGQTIGIGSEIWLEEEEEDQEEQEKDEETQKRQGVVSFQNGKKESNLQFQTAQVSARAFGTADAPFAGEEFERGSCAFIEWMRLKKAVSPLLQPFDQGDPSSVRISSRSVRAALRERYLSEDADKSTHNSGGAAGVHRRIATHLIDEAAGVWNDELGVVFRTYEQLDEQPLTLETLPRHLSKAGAWTDCIQLLCDLNFLRRRCLNQLMELHVEDCKRSLSLLENTAVQFFPETMEAQQLEVLQKRMSEVLEFIDKNRETLHRMPLLAVQQAANQPAHSAPEIAALVSLVFEPSSSARFGMRTEQAHSLESSRQTTTGHLLEYSPAMARLSASNIPGTKAVARTATPSTAPSSPTIHSSSPKLSPKSSRRRGRSRGARPQSSLKMPEFGFDRAPSGASKQSKGGSFDFAEIPQVMIVDGGESGGEEGDDSALDGTENRSLDMLEAAQSHKPGFFYDGVQEEEAMSNKFNKRASFESKASGESSQESSVRGFSRAGSDSKSRRGGNFGRAASDESRRSAGSGRTSFEEASQIKALRKKQQIEQARSLESSLADKIGDEVSPMATARTGDDHLVPVKEVEEESVEPWFEWVNKGECAWAKGKLDHVKGFNHVAISSDESPSCGVALVSVSCTDGCVSIYDAESMGKIYSFSGHSEGVNCSTFNSECDRVASCSDDCSLRIWSPPDYDNTNRVLTGKGRCIAVCRGHPQGGWSGHTQPVTRCEFSPDGNIVVSCSDDKTIKTWDPETGFLQHTLEGHNGWLHYIAHAPSAPILASAADDGLLKLWSIGVAPNPTDPRGDTRAKLLGDLVGHTSPVSSCCFSNDNFFLASSSDDRSIRIWSVKTLSLDKLMSVPRAAVMLRFDREAWRIWAVLEDGLLVVLDVATKSPLLAIFPLPRGIGGPAGAWAIQPEAGNTCTCAGGDGIVYQIRLHNARHAYIPPPPVFTPPEKGEIQIADDDDDTEEIEWLEYSGPVRIDLERIGGNHGSACVSVTTAGTNDDDPDFSAGEFVIQWESGEDGPKPVYISMSSYNDVEWDSLSTVRRDDVDSGAEVDVSSRLAAFGSIAYVEGRIVNTRMWHPPLINDEQGLVKFHAAVADAKREYATGADGSAERLKRCEMELQEASARGDDAALGLVNGSIISNSVAVVNLDCEINAGVYSDPADLNAAISDMAIEACKRCERAGARGVVVWGGCDAATVLRKRDADIFDETTGQWDPDAADQDRVNIPVVHMARSEALGRGKFLDGRHSAIMPRAPNHAFWLKTGIEPHMLLDMKGDTDFEIVIKDARGANLSATRQRVTIKIVTVEEMRAREEAAKLAAAAAEENKEVAEADEAEALARREREEADAAIAAFLEEEREAKEAEALLERMTIEQMGLSNVAEEKARVATVADEAADKVKGQRDVLVAEAQEKAKVIRETEFKLSQVPKDDKGERKEVKGKLHELSEALQKLVDSADKLKPEIASLSAEADGLWLEADEAQQDADDMALKCESQEAVYRRERAEADRAREICDKEVAEAEEAEENARRERAEAVAALAKKRGAEEAAEKLRAEELAKRAEFEKMVDAAARGMAEIEEEKRHQAEKEERERVAKIQKEKEDSQRLIAEGELKRQQEAEAFAKKARENEDQWKAAQEERRAAAEAKQAAQEAASSVRFPWRKSRQDLEAGFTRRPMPRLSQAYWEVAKEWEDPPGGNSKDVLTLDPKANVAVEKLTEFQKVHSMQLATSDFLQHIHQWEGMSGTLVLEEDQVKVSGRFHHEDDHEDISHNMSEEAIAEWEDELRMLSKTTLKGRPKSAFLSDEQEELMDITEEKMEQDEEEAQAAMSTFAAANAGGDDNEIAGAAAMYAQKQSYAGQSGETSQFGQQEVKKTKEKESDAGEGVLKGSKAGSSMGGSVSGSEAGEGDSVLRPPTAGSFMSSRPSTRNMSRPGTRGFARVGTGHSVGFGGLEEAGQSDTASRPESQHGSNRGSAPISRSRSSMRPASATPSVKE